MKMSGISVRRINRGIYNVYDDGHAMGSIQNEIGSPRWVSVIGPVLHYRGTLHQATWAFGWLLEGKEPVEVEIVFMRKGHWQVRNPSPEIPKLDIKWTHSHTGQLAWVYATMTNQFAPTLLAAIIELARLIAKDK
jgi:hypothetical protein